VTSVQHGLPAKQGTLLESLVKKLEKGKSFAPTPKPYTCPCARLFNETDILFLFSACLLYFHKGVRWRVLGGRKKKVFPRSLSLAMTPYNGDLLFTLILQRLREGTTEETSVQHFISAHCTLWMLDATDPTALIEKCIQKKHSYRFATSQLASSQPTCQLIHLHQMSW